MRVGRWRGGGQVRAHTGCFDQTTFSGKKINMSQSRRACITKGKSGGQQKIFLHFQAKKSTSKISSNNTASSSCDHKKSSSTNASIPEVDRVRKYEYLLKSSAAISPIDEHYCTFAVKNMHDGKLKRHSYMILRRRPILFNGGAQFIFSCSCNSDRVEVVKKIPEKCQQESANSMFTDGFEDCLHILAAQRIIANFDQRHGISAASLIDQESNDHGYARNSTELDNVYTLLDDAGTVMVRHDGSYSMVIVNCHCKLECRGCRLKYTCIHVRTVKEALEDGCPDLVEFQECLDYDGTEKINIPQVMSTEKISFLVQAPVNQHGATGEQLFPDEHGTCQHGHAWSADNPVLESWVDKKCPLYSVNSIKEVTTYYRCCCDPLCSERKFYDGNSDAILNMSQFLLDHGVLRDYLRMFLICGIPLTAYYRIWSWRLLDCGATLPTTFSCEKLRYAWYGFMKLLDTDMAENFSCSQCGQEPQTVIMDGLTLGVQRRYLDWKDALREPEQVLHGSRHKDRVFIPSEECRRLLSKYCSKGIEEQKDFDRLMELVDLHQPTLGPLLREILCMPDPSPQPPKALAAFLKALACSSPVSALISQSEDLHQALMNVAEGASPYQPPVSFKLIQREAPVLAQLLTGHEELPDSCKEVIREICRIARAPFSGEAHQLPAVTGDNMGEDAHCYFPTLPQKCHRGTYAMDKSVRPEKDCDKNKRCTKKERGHMSLSPGIFIMLCPHGICYGYNMMKSMESPNVPFTVMRTRYNRAPKRVVYDNACNLLTYCLNRDPVFFKKTKFLVDRFHWRNHKGCSVGHSAGAYGDMQHVNTQAAEQCNSQLKKLRPMLAYMKLNNFHSHVRLTLWFYNLKKSGGGQAGFQQLLSILSKYA